MGSVGAANTYLYSELPLEPGFKLPHNIITSDRTVHFNEM